MGHYWHSSSDSAGQWAAGAFLISVVASLVSSISTKMIPGAMGAAVTGLTTLFTLVAFVTLSDASSRQKLRRGIERRCTTVDDLGAVFSRGGDHLTSDAPIRHSTSEPSTKRRKEKKPNQVHPHLTSPKQNMLLSKKPPMAKLVKPQPNAADTPLRKECHRLTQCHCQLATSPPAQTTQALHAPRPAPPTQSRARKAPRAKAHAQVREHT